MQDVDIPLAILFCALMVAAIFIPISCDNRARDRVDTVIAEFTQVAQGMNDLEVQDFFAARKCKAPEMSTKSTNGNVSIVRTSKNLTTRYRMTIEYSQDMTVSAVSFIGKTPPALNAEKG